MRLVDVYLTKDTKLGNMPAKGRLDVKLFYDKHIKISLCGLCIGLLLHCYLCLGILNDK